MRKVCIIGKSGQLGGALFSLALVHGYEPLAPDHKTLDITDSISVRRCLEAWRPDVVMNTAAFQRLADCESDPVSALRLNTAAVHSLATLCFELGIALVTISTDYVFDGTKGSPYREDDTPRPLQMYGISKLAGEYAALAAHPTGAWVVRTSALYGGEKGSPSKGNFVLTMRDKLLRGERVEVTSDLITSPTYAEHAAQAIFQLIQASSSGLYHLAGEGAASWYDFACEIQRVFSLPGLLVPVAAKEKAGEGRRPRYTALENTKAHALGISLPPWQEGVRAYRDFLRNSNI